METKKWIEIGRDILYPIHLEPKYETMNKKLIINIAPTGGVLTKEQNPYQPYNVEEIASEVIESHRAGAAMWHIHVRKDGLGVVEPGIYKDVMDRVFDKCPDIVTVTSVISNIKKEGLERLKPLVDPLVSYGKKYIRLADINTVGFAFPGTKFMFAASEQGIQEEARYMEERGIKPELAAYNLQAIDVIKQHLIKNNAVSKPYYIALLQGVHNSTPSGPDPFCYTDLMQMVQRLPKQDCRWGMIAGGRNWLPLTVLAIMLGADVVRVGKEDAVYRYPFSDEKIKSCAEVVKQVRTIAEGLGREIATSSEAEKILGLK